MEGFRMPNYRTLVSQAQRQRELALLAPEDVAARNRSRYAAYLWLADSPQGQTLLDDWCLLLLEPALTPEDEGAKRFIQRVLKIIREEAPRALQEED